jgi:hypothetical protein
MEEHTAGLDRKLDDSLRELDGLLIEEQQRLAKERVSASSPGTGGIGGAGGSSTVGASDASGDDSGSPTPASGRGSSDTNSSATGSSGGAVGGGGVGGGDSGGPVPDDVGDGSDDDIIARQLREAAMAESDPELREKLWQEYREYKSSTKAGGATASPTEE